MNFSGFADGLAGLQGAGRLRTRRAVASAQGARIRIEGRDILSFASNDYLGLANDPRLVAAVHEGVTRYGVGSGASHLLSGHFEAHQQLEERLARFVGAERALLFGSGYLANLGILGALADRNSVIFADKLNHACLNEGAALSRATFRRYAHLDLAQLERRLAETRGGRKIIATDAVFSMDGDIAPLAGMLALAEKHDALLVIDDAHGFGVLGPQGRGTLAHLNLRSPRIVYMATLGKAAGVYGAFAAGDASLIEWIMQSARSYIFTTAAPPLLAHALLTSIDLVQEEEVRRQRLRSSILLLRDSLRLKHWRLALSETAIQPIIIGGNNEALAASQALYARGIWAPAIRPPTVPINTARLRVSLSAAHSRDDVAELIAALHHAEAQAA
jgi:8-amino-7-oxononanoate synthase